MPTERASIYIGGAWTQALDGQRFDALNPATGEVLASLARGSRDDADRALAAASEAFLPWARRSAFERAAAMERVAEAIEARRDELARTLTLDQGKPLVAEAYGEVEELLVYFRMAAAEATRSGRAHAAVGGCEQARPRLSRAARRRRRHHALELAVHDARRAHRAGARGGQHGRLEPGLEHLVCAPRVLAECLADADLPAGVFNLVTGPGAVVGDAIAGDPRTAVVGFIGSTETGLQVAARAAGKDAAPRDGRQRAAGRSSTTPTSTRPSRRRSRPPS